MSVIFPKEKTPVLKKLVVFLLEIFVYNCWMETKTINFGEHLTIDGYNGNFDRLNDKDLVLKVLNDLPEILGMKKLSKPEVYFAPDNDKNDPGGWSGFVVIAESHISLHTFPKRLFISADVYTCKSNLDSKTIIDYFTEAFKLSDAETNFIKRGTRYPLKNLI